jgi:hypothetical protein
MKLNGGCYCGAVRYEVEGESVLALQCHCRECQYFTGGMPNVIIGFPEDGVVYVKGEPVSFRRVDLEEPITREFCSVCGTHLAARGARLPGVVVIKVGTMDDPAAFAGPKLAIYTVDSQAFHHVPEDLPTFERMPG